MSEETQPKQPQPIKVVEGALQPRDNGELFRQIELIAAGGGFPERFDSPAKRMAAYNLAHSMMGGQWQLALNHIAIIKGQMCIYGEFPGSLAERTGEVAEKNVFVIDSEYKKICLENGNLNKEPYAGVCQIQRKGRLLKEFTYTIDEAKNAGQYPAKKRDGSLNNDSPWMKFTKIMLMRKAMGLAIKMEFPDALIGVPIAEYDHDSAPDLQPIKDVTPSDEKSVDKIIQRIAELSSNTKEGADDGITESEKDSGIKMEAQIFQNGVGVV